MLEVNHEYVGRCEVGGYIKMSTKEMLGKEWMNI